MALKKFCRKQGCQNLTDSGYCEQHTSEQHNYDKYRGSATERGYDAKWRKARLRFLKQRPLCKHCQDEGQLTAATVVDHVIPHKGNKGLFWSEHNWQSLCKRHHDIKTATKDGGFGR